MEHQKVEFTSRLHVHFSFLPCLRLQGGLASLGGRINPLLACCGKREELDEEEGSRTCVGIIIRLRLAASLAALRP